MAWYPKLNSIPNKINYLLPFGNNTTMTHVCHFAIAQFVSLTP